jgi:anti-sigma factor RsiW
MTEQTYSCNDVENLLEAALDGELPAVQAELVAEHLRTCPRCVASERERRSISHAVRMTLPHYQAPAELLARVRADIAAAAQDSQPARYSAMPFARSAPHGGKGSAFAYAASLVAVATLGWIANEEFHSRAAVPVASVGSPTVSAGASNRLDALSSADRVSNDVVTAHVRSLLPGHLTDVASTDQHTVKPWFSGKLDYSPLVANLDSAGFPLVGGRLDYVGRRPVAALVYKRRQHVINVFLWPSVPESDGPRTEHELVFNGYTMRCWAQNGMTYCAVSDVARADLTILERLYRSAAPETQAATR